MDRIRGKALSFSEIAGGPFAGYLWVGQHGARNPWHRERNFPWERSTRNVGAVLRQSAVHADRLLPRFSCTVRSIP
jgi:hypothetical protein